MWNLKKLGRQILNHGTIREVLLLIYFIPSCLFLLIPYFSIAPPPTTGFFLCVYDTISVFSFIHFIF